MTKERVSDENYRKMVKNGGPLGYTTGPTDVEIIQVGEVKHRRRKEVVNGVVVTVNRRSRLVTNSLNEGVAEIPGGTGQSISIDDWNKIKGV